MRALSTPQININNVNVRIVPNSLRYDGGEGEVNVRAASGGGNQIESVHTSNAETKIGKVMFDVFLDTDLDGFIAQWKENIGVNSISFSPGTGTLGLGTTRLPFRSAWLKPAGIMARIVLITWSGLSMKRKSTQRGIHTGIIISIDIC